MRLTQGNAVRGAAMATTCDNCHGANSVSGDAAFPNLVGQSVAAIYKQLEDYKSAKRNAAVDGRLRFSIIGTGHARPCDTLCFAEG